MELPDRKIEIENITSELPSRKETAKEKQETYGFQEYANNPECVWRGSNCYLEKNRDISFSFLYSFSQSICGDDDVECREVFSQQDYRLGLVDAFKPGLNVYLFKSDGSKIITAKTADTYINVGTVVETSVTMLADVEITNFEYLLEEFNVAVISDKPVNFEGLMPKLYENDEHIKLLDKQARSSSEMASLLRLFDGYLTLNDLSQKPPLVHRLPIIKDSFILTYKVSEEFGQYNGPRVLSIDNKIHALTGQVSFDFITFFKIGERLFAGSRSCGESGHNGWQVFEIGNFGVKWVYFNADWST
jgi:hypothetical protein